MNILIGAQMLFVAPSFHWPAILFMVPVALAPAIADDLHEEREYVDDLLDHARSDGGLWERAPSAKGGDSHRQDSRDLKGGY